MKARQKLFILGASGLAKEVIDLVEEYQQYVSHPLRALLIEARLQKVTVFHQIDLLRSSIRPQW